MGCKNTMELRHSCLIVATDATSRTLCGATEVSFQHHQILHLPRTTALKKIDPRHPPTSPNNYCKLLLLPRNCKCNIWLKIRDLLLPIYIRRIGAWSHRALHFAPARLQSLPVPSWCWRQFCMEKCNVQSTFRAPAISLNFTTCCACHKKLHSNITATSQNIAPATKSDTATATSLNISKSIAPATKNDADAWSSWRIKRAVHCANKMHPPTSANIWPATKKTLQHHDDFSLLYSAPPYSTLLYSSLLYSSPLYSTLPTLLFSTLLFPTELFSLMVKTP